MPDLFDVMPAQARDHDPATSHEAAESLTESDITRLYGLILGALRASPAGLTVPEIADRLNIPRDTISPRMRPMQGKGYVRCTNENRIPSVEGHSRACFVWRAGNDEDKQPVHDHAGTAAAAFDGESVGR